MKCLHFVLLLQRSNEIIFLACILMEKPITVLNELPSVFKIFIWTFYMFVLLCVYYIVRTDKISVTTKIKSFLKFHTDIYVLKNITYILQCTIFVGVFIVFSKLCEFTVLMVLLFILMLFWFGFVSFYN